jgi:hypothetical protein
MIYVLITLAALLRLVAPLGGSHYVVLLSFAGAGMDRCFYPLYSPLRETTHTVSGEGRGRHSTDLNAIRPPTIRPAADGSMLVDRRTLNALSG